MSTRYYLDTAALSGADLPTTEQSPDDPSPFSYWGISGSVPLLKNLKTTPNTIYQYVYESSGVTPPTTGTIWMNWWRTPQFASASVLTGGTVGFYMGHSDWSNPSDRGRLKPRFHVYQWRPGVGKVGTLLAPTTGTPPPNSGSEFRLLSQSFSYSGVTIAPGDMLVFELWNSASFYGTPVGVGLQYAYTYAGFDTGSLTPDGVPDTVYNDICSFIDFTEDFPPFAAPGALTPSSVYVQKVEPHALDSNKLTVTFSGPIATSSISFTNFSLVPPLVVKHAAVVPGTNNTKVDLHFGGELDLQPETFALWRIDEETGTAVSDAVGNYPLTAANTTIRKDGLYKICRQFNGVNSGLAGVSTTGALGLFRGNFVVEALVRLTGSRAGAEIVVVYSGIDTDVTGSENYQFALGINGAALPYTFWEQGLGTDITVNSAVPLTVNQLQHLAVRCSSSAGRRIVDFWVNGVSSGGILSAALPDGGGGANTKFMIGRSVTGGAANYFSGFIDSVRITSGSRSTAAITSGAIAAIYPFSRGTSYALSASNIVDAGGSTILEPSCSFTFQYLGQNAFGTGTFDGLARVYGSGTLTIPGTFGADTIFDTVRVFGATVNYVYAAVSASSDPGLGFNVLYDVPCDCSIAYTPPSVSNLVPAAGSQIQSNTPLQFDITDDGPIRRIIIEAQFLNNGITEVIHDGLGFGLKYQGGTNSRTAIAGGYRYVMLRDGGWPENPTLTPFAIDVSGSENL